MNDETLVKIAENTRDTSKDTSNMLGALERAVASNEESNSLQRDKVEREARDADRFATIFEKMIDSMSHLEHLKHLPKINQKLSLVLWTLGGVIFISLTLGVEIIKAAVKGWLGI